MAEESTGNENQEKEPQEQTAPAEVESAQPSEIQPQDIPSEPEGPDHILADTQADAQFAELPPPAEDLPAEDLPAEEVESSGEEPMPSEVVEEQTEEVEEPAEAPALEETPEPEEKPAKKKAGRKKSKAKEEEPAAEPEEPVQPAEPPEADDSKKWYVVKVQSGREESIKEAIERRVKIEGLEEYFDQILIPVEKEKVLHKGKRVERERKLFPGYIMAKVEYNDRILYLFRETSGVGDFVGGGPNQVPQPMTEQEVARMTHQKYEPDRTKRPTAGAAPYSHGERVRVKEGVFSGMEGDIKEVLESKEQVRVELFVLGRPVSVELDYWQVESV